ncbi:hypothetical protein [Dyadobacter sp. LHD-138]|uniref:hypothetical protein n=1 Tax=Dyadobacter sp. LHD-138 TaxID=3071413 RepID=UPI0027DF6A9D|nr:hypothetical protein [Dyadobacter sp. LHD-138]MDQ6480250.1 hypothetical protein [Dyadobacter sp. LHD-138]
MSQELSTQNLDPLFEVRKHLYDDLYESWRYRCSRSVEFIDEQFDLELTIYMEIMFNRILNATLNRLSDESENIARAKYYGYQLREILSHVQNGKNLSYNYDFVRQQFLNFEQNVKSRLNLDIEFSDNPKPNIISKPTSTISKINDIQELITLDEQKKFARSQLQFLIEVRKDEPIMTEKDYELLLIYVDEMLTKKTIPEVTTPLLHINQRKVTGIYVQEAFSKINYQCFKGKQEWIIDSYMSIFKLTHRESKVKNWTNKASKRDCKMNSV